MQSKRAHLPRERGLTCSRPSDTLALRKRPPFFIFILQAKTVGMWHFIGTSGHYASGSYAPKESNEVAIAHRIRPARWTSGTGILTTFLKCVRLPAVVSDALRTSCLALKWRASASVLSAGLSSTVAATAPDLPTMFAGTTVQPSQQLLVLVELLIAAYAPHGMVHVQW